MTLTLLIAIIITLIALLAVVIYLHIRIVKKKNEALADHQIQIEEYQQKLRSVLWRQDRNRIETGETDGQQLDQITGKEDNKELFLKMDRMVVHHKMYLDPEMSRDMICKRLHIDKNRMTTMFQEACGITTFTTYMNSLRIEHACKLLIEQPNYTIQAIAEESGFKTVRHFQTTFKKHVGMTPMEFRYTKLGLYH